MLDPALASGLDVFEPVSLVLPGDDAVLTPVVPVPIVEEGLTTVARVVAVPASEPDVLEPVSLLLPSRGVVLRLLEPRIPATPKDVLRLVEPRLLPGERLAAVAWPLSEVEPVAPAPRTSWERGHLWPRPGSTIDSASTTRRTLRSMSPVERRASRPAARHRGRSGSPPTLCRTCSPPRSSANRLPSGRVRDSPRRPFRSPERARTLPASLSSRSGPTWPATPINPEVGRAGRANREPPRAERRLGRDEEPPPPRRPETGPAPLPNRLAGLIERRLLLSSFTWLSPRASVTAPTGLAVVPSVGPSVEAPPPPDPPPPCEPRIAPPSVPDTDAAPVEPIAVTGWADGDCCPAPSPGGPSTPPPTVGMIAVAIEPADQRGSRFMSRTFSCGLYLRTGRFRSRLRSPPHGSVLRCWGSGCPRRDARSGDSDTSNQQAHN